MKAVLVFKGGACSLVFYQRDSAFADYLRQHPHYQDAIEKSGLNEEDFVTELLKPFLASCLSMQHELRNAYQHLQSGNLSIVCSYHQSLTFVAVCGDGEESIDFMRRKLAALYALLRMSLGPVIETITDNPQAARQKFSSLFTTWCYLVKNEQCFLVEAVEKLYITQASEDLSKKCVEALEDVVAKWNSPGANVAKPSLKIDHAALFSHDKLLALYSKRKRKLSPYDLLLSIVYVLNRFPPAEWHEKPANVLEEDFTANLRPDSVQSLSSNENYETSDDRYYSDRDGTATGHSDVELDVTSADSSALEYYVSPSSTPTPVERASQRQFCYTKKIGNCGNVEHIVHAEESDVAALNASLEKEPMRSSSSSSSKVYESSYSPKAGALASLETELRVEKISAVSTEPNLLLTLDKVKAENREENCVSNRKTEIPHPSGFFEHFEHCEHGQSLDKRVHIDSETAVVGGNDVSGDYHAPIGTVKAEAAATMCQPVSSSELCSRGCDNAIAVSAAAGCAPCGCSLDDVVCRSNLSADCEVSNPAIINHDADDSSPSSMPSSPDVVQSISSGRGLGAFDQDSPHHPSVLSYSEGSLKSLVNSIALLATQALNTASDAADTGPTTTVVQQAPVPTGNNTSPVAPKPQPDSTMPSPDFHSVAPAPKRYSSLLRESYAVERVFVRNDNHLVPKDMYIISVLPGINLVLFSEDLPQRSKMAQFLQIGMENLHALQDPAGSASLAIVRRRIQSVHEAIESIAKGLREIGLAQHAAELADHWHSVGGSQMQRRELSEHLGASLVLDHDLPQNVECGLSQTLTDLADIFTTLYGAPWLGSSSRAGKQWQQQQQQSDDASSSVVAALVDSVRNFLRSEVCSPDVGEFFVARARRNFTMAQFQSSPFEGLFHFVLINRTSNYVAAPSLSADTMEDSRDASSQQLAVARLNAFIRRRLWENVEWIYSQLQRAGCVTTLVWDADFVFSYMLWFEDSNGVSRQIPQEPALVHMLPPIGDFDGTFYRALTNALFKDEEVQCCEMFGVHLGILPESVILKQCQRLAHFVCYYIPVETEPI